MSMVNPYDVPPPVDYKPPTAALSNAGPALPTIFGTINVVLGMIGLLGLVAWWGLYRLPVTLYDSSSLLHQLLSPAWSVVQTLLLTISGVGLLKRRKWGRVAAICYGLPAVIWGAGSLTMQLSFQLRFMAQVSQASIFDEPASLLAFAFSTGLGCIGLAYAIALSFFMFNRSLRAQLH